VTNSVDGGPKDQVLESGVAVRTHHYQVGLQSTCRAYDFGAGTAAMDDAQIGFQAASPERAHNILQVLLA